MQAATKIRRHRRPHLCSSFARALLRGMRREDGQALVELALVLPVLLLVVFGIVDFGRAMNYDTQATHLANEAARYAAVDYVPAGATTLAQWLLPQADSPELRNGTGSVGSPSVTVCYPNGTSNVGDPVKVLVSFTYSWLPILNLADTTITRSATMRIENPPTGSFYAAAGACPP